MLVDYATTCTSYLHVHRLHLYMNCTAVNNAILCNHFFATEFLPHCQFRPWMLASTDREFVIGEFKTGKKIYLLVKLYIFTFLKSLNSVIRYTHRYAE